MSRPSRPLSAPSRRDQRANARALAFASRTRPRPELPSDRDRAGEHTERSAARDRTAHGRNQAGIPTRAMASSASARPAPTRTVPTRTVPTRTVPTRTVPTRTVPTQRTTSAGSTVAPRAVAELTRGAGSAGPQLRRGQAFSSVGAAALAPSPRRRAVEDLKVRAAEEAKNRAPSRLRVVPRAPRNRRRLFGMLVVCVLTVMTVVIGFAAVAMHATLAQDQLVLDTGRTRVQRAERVNQHLRVEVAELESPERVVAVAASLGMSSPDEVTFMPASGTAMGTAGTALDGASHADAPRAGR